MIKATFTVGLLMVLSFHVFGQTRADANFELYVLIGQSNMAGRGQMTAEFEKMEHPRVYMWNAAGQWVPAKHPVHFDKPKYAAVGPGLAFGMGMAEANPKVKVGLIPCAVGGTSIEQWTPGAYDEKSKAHPFDDAILRIRAAMKYGFIKGVIWHQGESNSSEKKSRTYLNRLDTLVNRIRAEVGDPKLPFVAGELGRYRERYAIINSLLAKVPGIIPFTGVVSSEGLVHMGDSTHFDGASATRLGHRYAEKMIEMHRGKN